MRRLHFILSTMTGCAVGAAAPDPAPECTNESTETCLGIGPSTSAAEYPLRSVRDTPLATCSTAPLTGFFRDGQCRTGPRDRGVHVVCAQVDEAFLAYTAAQGNDLSTPRPQLGFQGLAPGDRWCLCAARWEEARVAGVAPPVVLEATHPAALRSTTMVALESHALP